MAETFEFRKATRKAVRARIALTGPTGSGKTYTALVLATTFGGDPSDPDRVAFIDTENGSASTYADEFNFRVLELGPPYSPSRYVAALQAAIAAGFRAIVIDSYSHAWAGTGGVLEIVDEQATRTKGNKFAAWSKGTAEHNTLLDAILRCPVHLIVCLRTKMTYVQEPDGRGGTRIRKVGLEPIQRDGVEYEFTLVGDLDLSHTLVVTKTRLKALDEAVVGKPGPVFARTILEELEQGEEAPPAPAPAAAAPVTHVQQAQAPTNGTGASVTVPSILEGIEPVKHDKPTSVREWRELLRWALQQAAPDSLIEQAGLLQTVGAFDGKDGKVVPERLATMPAKWAQRTYGQVKRLVEDQRRQAEGVPPPPESDEEAARAPGAMRFPGDGCRLCGCAVEAEHREEGVCGSCIEEAKDQERTEAQGALV